MVSILDIDWKIGAAHVVESKLTGELFVAKKIVLSALSEKE